MVQNIFSVPHPTALGKRKPLQYDYSYRRKGQVCAPCYQFFLAIAGPLFAADAGGLVGTRRLVSWQVIVESAPPQNVFGSHPKGFLVLTREGRSIVLTTAENRRAGMSDAERAALHKSMLAYSGRYRIEGNDFITVVEASWNEEWNGTEQRRHFRIEGDKLFIESAPGPSIISPGKTNFRRIIWQRDRKTTLR